MNSIVEDLLAKKRSKVYILGIVILVSLILINVCLEMIAFNYTNMQNGLLDNDRLKLLQVFGQNSETNDMNLDEDVIMNIEHVLFEVKTYPITMNLYDENGEDYGDDVIFLYKFPEEYCQYIGIEGTMKDNVIYCHEGSVSKGALENAQFSDEFKELGLDLAEYQGSPPQMLEGDQFATEETYNKIMAIERERIGDEYADLLYSTPQYLIGVDDTINVYDVVDELKTSFPGYEIQVSYQASGLRIFVENSSNMLVFQILVGIAIVLISFVIIYVFVNTFISKQVKNMMILYINGMTRKNITNQLYNWMLKRLLKPGICVVVLSGVSYIILSQLVFKTSFSFIALLLILVVNIIVELGSIKFLKWSIRKKIKIKTANANITSMIRN